MAAPAMRKTGVKDVEWSKTGTCMNRPDEGWLHNNDDLDNVLGVTYAVRYIGCMEVTVSMKTLDFDTRTAVARESISRVAEAAGLKSAVKKKRDKRIIKFLGDNPNLTHAGIDVILNITTETVTMTNMETTSILLEHNMEEISFASGGDSETLDFVAYVAKDAANSRACHVLECGGGVASEVIITIAQAFELRYKQMLKRKKPPVVVPDREVHVTEESAWGDEPTYYNDGADMEEIRRAKLGGVAPPPIPPLPDHYSARPSNLPVPEQFSTPTAQPATHDPGSPLYENTTSSPQPNVVTGIPTSSKQSSVASPRNEPWFHGKLKRHEAERLLTADGDFLVRESSHKEGQFVLSGMKNNLIVHLLLVDPEGVVRTKDRTFDNVSHLISYHKDNIVPILSQDIELYLTRPLLK